MKIHEFRDCCWAICVTIGMVMLFMYGLIWMNNQYSIDDRVKYIYKDIGKVSDYVDILNNTEITDHKQTIELIQNLDNTIMPSCLIKEPQWSRTPKKR